MNLLKTNIGFQLTKEKINYPITLENAKRHLRIENSFNDDDEYIEDLIYAATQMAENYINKDIAKTKNTLRIDSFTGDTLTVYEGNFLSIIDVVDSNDASIGTIEQTSAHNNYFLIEWENSITSEPITITFYTGYNEYTTPEIIKQAILVKVGDLYDNSRTSLVYSGLTDTKVFENILNHYVAVRF